jgi:hypothetical protein
MRRPITAAAHVDLTEPKCRGTIYLSDIVCTNLRTFGQRPGLDLASAEGSGQTGSFFALIKGEGNANYSDEFRDGVWERPPGAL